MRHWDASVDTVVFWVKCFDSAFGARWIIFVCVRMAIQVSLNPRNVIGFLSLF